MPDTPPPIQAVQLLIDLGALRTQADGRFDVAPWIRAGIERELLRTTIKGNDLSWALLGIEPGRRVVVTTTEGGRSVAFIGGPIYHAAVQQLWELLYESSLYIDPYAALPEDPSREGEPFDVMKASFPAAYFSTATIDQVRRYLVFCTRAERFCDGRMASEWDSGALPAALRRFRELWGSRSKAKART